MCAESMIFVVCRPIKRNIGVFCAVGGVLNGRNQSIRIDFQNCSKRRLNVCAAHCCAPHSYEYDRIRSIRRRWNYKIHISVWSRLHAFGRLPARTGRSNIHFSKSKHNPVFRRLVYSCTHYDPIATVINTTITASGQYRVGLKGISLTNGKILTSVNCVISRLGPGYVFRGT